MFAVIKTGGKQYKVAKGDVIDIEKLELNDGDKVEFPEVLLIEDGDKVEVGTPFLEKAKVSGVLVRQTKADKVIAFKKKRRKSSSCKVGHRQRLSVVKIEEITL